MLQRCLRQSSRALSAAAELRSSQVQRTHFLPAASFAPANQRSFSVSAWRAAEAEGAKAEQEKEAAKPEEAKEDPIAKELEAKKLEVLDVTDKWKRQIAEFRNLQAQTKREVQAARDFGLQKFARDLMDSADNLDRALGTVPQELLTDQNKELKALHDGLRMTETIFINTLKKHGLERFDPAETSEKFDPNKHEATFQVPQPDKEHNTCFHTQQKGFMLNGRVLRAAKVGIVKNE